MSTTLTISKIGPSIVWDYENALSIGVSLPFQSSFAPAINKLTNGTAANQADLLYATKITLAASGSQTLTLSALTDVFGNTINMARVKAIYIDCSPTPSASPAALGIGNATSNGAFIGTLFDDATAVIKLNSGSCFCVFAPDATGYPVTASTADQLKFLNESGSNSCIFNLAIVGCSA